VNSDEEEHRIAINNSLADLGLPMLMTTWSKRGLSKKAIRALLTAGLVEEVPMLTSFSKMASSLRPVRISMRSSKLSSYEPGGNRVEVANAGARLILAPDWQPIVWSEAERAKGQAWGLKTIESFHTHGTPPVERQWSVWAPAGDWLVEPDYQRISTASPFTRNTCAFSNDWWKTAKAFAAMRAFTQQHRENVSFGFLSLRQPCSVKGFSGQWVQHGSRLMAGFRGAVDCSDRVEPRLVLF
jgi:hypothetical protein